MFGDFWYCHLGLVCDAWQDVLQLYPAHTTYPWPAYMSYMLHIFGTQLYCFDLAICHILAITKLNLATDLYHLPSKLWNILPAGAVKCY